MNEKTSASERIRIFSLTSLFAAIVLLMAFTPIGFINLGVIKATIVHIPVIIGSILLGPKVGAFLGTLFGLTSLFNNTVSPLLLSFAFSPLIPLPGTDRGSLLALVVCFIPRILVGVFPYYVDKYLTGMREEKNWRIVSLFTAGVVGSMTNTLLVMNLIYFLLKNAYAAAYNVDPDTVYRLISTVIVMHGIPEAIVAGVFTSGIVKALLSFRTKR